MGCIDFDSDYIEEYTPGKRTEVADGISDFEVCTDQIVEEIG